MLPDRSGRPAEEHGRVYHQDDAVDPGARSGNELAAEQSMTIDDRPVRGASYWQLSLNRLMRKKLAMVCLSVIVLMYGGAVLSPLVTPYGYTDQDISQSRQRPSLAHPFGTDRLGRDMLTRVIYGLRTTVIITVIALLVGTIFLGIALGLLSGYMGRWVDAVIMRTGEITSSIPDIFLILIFVATLKPPVVEAVRNFEDAIGIDWIIRLGVLDFTIISLALSIFSWFGMARLVRGQVLQVRENQYTEAALATGASTARILRVHVFPNVLSPVIVVISYALAGFVGAEIVLSWIGVGVQPPTPSLGRMMFENGSVSVLRAHPHLILFPMAIIALVLFCFNLLGDAVNDAFNPRAR